jgi:osmotically-inducible protein OsmY/sporulation protein YlmC with PRC-barrel domain
MNNRSNISQPSFRIGAPVFATDGRAGKLDKIVVDPGTQRITHLIVGRGLLHKEDRVVPVELVERATPEGIYLHATSEELERQPLYQEESFVTLPPDVTPPAGYALPDVLLWGPPYTGVPPPFLPVIEHVVRHGVPEGEVVLERGVEVRAKGEVVGDIDHLLLDPRSQKITHLVVRLFDAPKLVIVPFDWVEDLGDGYVNLKRSREELLRLQPFSRRSDDELAGAVKEALQREGGKTFSGVQVQVDRGVVRLSGTTPTVADKAAADRVAREVPGVIDVRNELLPDTAIMARVTAALAEDKRTALTPIEVSSVAGTVTLSGEVDSAETRAAAEEIARQVPGVKLVVNNLSIRPRKEIIEPRIPVWQHLKQM